MEKDQNSITEGAGATNADKEAESFAPEAAALEEAIKTPSLSQTQDITENPEEYTYKSRKERSGLIKKRKKGIRPSYIIIPVVILAVLLTAFLSLPLLLPQDAIAKNIWSGNINLSGLSQEEATQELANSYKPTSANFSVVFFHGIENEKSEKTSFKSEDIEFTLNPEETALHAYNFGRGENIFINSWNVLRSLVTNVDIGMVPTCNEELLSEILYNLGAKVHGEGEDMACIIENNTLTITPPTIGQSHDVSRAVKEFLENTQKGVYTNIPVTLKSNENDVIDADELYEKLSAEPKDAEYKIEGNTVIITDHVVGVTIDKAKLAALVDRVNQGMEGSIDVLQTIPQVTKESLQQSLFGTTLASFSSSYKSSTANRAYNVELASSKVNGIILADGAEFSYNSVIGNPNSANGYKMATVFADGKSTEGVGGGVCQVSSTLYCAVLRSDLAVVERRNHSLPVGYVPGGQDATVAYGAIDFRFKNNTGAPIKLVLENSNRTLTVSILGSANAKKKVEVISEKVSTTEPVMTQIQDPNLPQGTTKVITKGKPGSVYVTYKRVYDSNGAMVSESKTRSSYKATPGEVAVGTAIVPSTPTSTPETPPAQEPTDTPVKPEQPKEENPAQIPAENIENVKYESTEL